VSVKLFAALLVVAASARPAAAQTQEAESATSVATPSTPLAPLPLGAGALAPNLSPSASAPLSAAPVFSAPAALSPSAAAPALPAAAVPVAAAVSAPAADETPRAAAVAPAAGPSDPAASPAATPLEAPAGAPIARDPNSTRWITRFISGLEAELAKSAGRPEELSRRADFDAGAEDAERGPALRESRALPSEHPYEGWTRVVHFHDQDTIITGGMDGRIRFVDVSTGRLLREFGGHSGVIRALEVSPDARTLFSADDAGALLRWDLDAKDGAPQVLQAPTGRALRAFRLSPDGRVLAAGEHDGTIVLWDAASGRRLRSFDLGRTVYDLAYSWGGRYILAAGQDGVIRRVDAQTGAVVELAGHAGGVRALAVRPTDGLLMSAGEDGAIRSWSVESAREVADYRIPDKWVRSISFSPDGSAIYTGNINGRVDRLPVDAHGRVGQGRTLYSHDDVVFQTALSPRGDVLVSSGRDLRLGIMDADGRLLQLNGSGGPVHAMFLQEDGRLVGVSHDGSLLIWETPESRPRRIAAHAKSARALAVSPNGTVATGGDDKLIMLRRPGKVMLSLSGHTGRVRALAFSPDQKLLASSGDDLVLFLRDARTGRIRARIPLPPEIEVVHALAFSPDGRRIAIGGRDGLVREFDVRRQKLLPAWERRHAGYIRSLAYRPDGRVLASGGRDGSLWLWEARTGRALKQLKGHTDDVNSVEFDAHERLLSASDDKTVRVWDPRAPEKVFSGLRPFSSARFTRGGARVLAIDDRQEIASFDAGRGR